MFAIVKSFRCPSPHFHLNQAVGVIRDAKGALKTGYLDEVQPYDQTLERAHEVACQFVHTTFFIKSTIFKFCNSLFV